MYKSTYFEPYLFRTGDAKPGYVNYEHDTKIEVYVVLTFLSCKVAAHGRCNTQLLAPAKSQTPKSAKISAAPPLHGEVYKTCNKKRHEGRQPYSQHDGRQPYSRGGFQNIVINNRLIPIIKLNKLTKYLI